MLEITLTFKTLFMQTTEKVLKKNVICNTHYNLKNATNIIVYQKSKIFKQITFCIITNFRKMFVEVSKKL